MMGIYIPEKNNILYNMAKQTVLNKRSSVKDKAPVTGVLKPGEIAVNYCNGSETLYIENTLGQVIGFPNEKNLKEVERVASESYNDLNTRLKRIDGGLY